MATLFEMNVSHDQLVIAARHWLRKTRKCPIVVSEMATQGLESPDAIGWYGLTTHLVECKTSRADFLADRKKSFRHNLDMGVGDYRWFLTLPNVIRDVSELPKGFGWCEWQDGKIKTIRKADWQPQKMQRYETAILLSLIKRIGQTSPTGTSITCFTHETKNRAATEIDI